MLDTVTHPVDQSMRIRVLQWTIVISACFFLLANLVVFIGSTGHSYLESWHLISGGLVVLNMAYAMLPFLFATGFRTYSYQATPFALALIILVIVIQLSYLVFCAFNWGERYTLPGMDAGVP